MSAILDLEVFIQSHPEIRGHKKIGELLNGLRSELASLRARAEKAEAERDIFRELLLRIEWRSNGFACIFCHHNKWEGHAKDCALAAILNAELTPLDDGKVE